MSELRWPCRLAVIALLAAVPLLAATPHDPAVPTAWQVAAQSLDAVDTMSLPALDRGWLEVEDQLRDGQDLAPRFAVPNEVTVSPDFDGTWEQVDADTLMWRYRIKAAGATSLNLGFRRYRMPPGGRLLIYPANGRSDRRGPFTADDNEEHGELWTPVVRTDDLVVEVTLPAAERAALDLELGSINQGYRGFGAAGEKSGSCNMDVECLDPADSWRQEMRSVGVISTGGTTFCSGSLVNDTANDHKMYFMTANHCGITSGNAASLVVYWNYQNSFCRTPGSAASGSPGDGTLTQFHTGSFFRAAGAASDFTLVELDDPPVPAYDHFWAGWDRSTGDFTCSPGVPCATIHHPDTDEKRITYVTTNTATTSYDGTTSPGDGTHVWAHWATDPPGPFIVPGVTEPGSSGSPLYNAAGQYIGQLHGGPSSCGATGDDLSDYYGRFSVSWTGGGTNATRLSNWLDAGATGATSIGGIEACTAPGAPAIGTASATGANQIQVTWSDGSPTSTTFNVYRAIGTCAAPGTFGLVGAAVAGSPFTDSTVSGGTTYAYYVKGVDSSGGCESVASGCVEATATGTCTLPPTFAGLTSVTNPGSASCALDLAWSTATASCGGPVTYNVYRSTSPGFVPGAGTLLAGGIGGTIYSDTSVTLVSGAIEYYIVRAVDGSNAAEDGNTVVHSAAPTGISTLVETFEGALSGGGFDHAGWTHAALTGAVDWAQSTAQSQTPTHSWFSASQAGATHRVLTSPSFVPQPGTTLSFWHTFAFEGSVAQCYDGGTLEVSTDGGTGWTVVADANFTAGGFNGTVNGGFSNPLAGKRAWCSGSIGAMSRVNVDLAAYAGAVDAKVRWHEGDDSGIVATGWYVDSVTIANACIAGLLSRDDFETGDTSEWSARTP